MRCLIKVGVSGSAKVALSQDFENKKNPQQSGTMFKVLEVNIFFLAKSKHSCVLSSEFSYERPRPEEKT